MTGLSRRGLLSGLASVTASRSARSAAPASRAATPSSAATYTNVHDFGAKGDGKIDDTRAISAAIAAAPGGTVYFPPGIYVVSKTLVLKAGSTYRGSNPNSSVIKQANDANLIAVMADENYEAKRPTSSSGIQIEDLGIDGNSQNNKHGHGLLLMVDRSLVRHVLVDFPAEAGIVLIDQNIGGSIITNPAVENRIEDCTITQPGTYGIWVVDTNHSGRQTDGYMLNNVVKNALGTWGIRVERAAGWFIANNHVYHSAQNAIYLSHAECTYFYCNEIDHFGLTKVPPRQYFGLQVDFLMGGFRPSVFMGNVSATWEGLYPQNSYNYFQFNGDKYGQSNAVVVGNAIHNDPVGNAKTPGHANESTAFGYDAQPGGALDVSQVANTNDGALTFQSVPKGSGVQMASGGAASTPITASVAAGVGGGAVVAGLGIASTSRRARKRVEAELSTGHPAPSYRDSVAFMDVAETLNRWEVDAVSHVPEADWIHLTYFVPYRPIEVGQVAPVTGEVAASGAELSRVGLYEVLESGGLEVLGASGNRAADLWTVPNSLTPVELKPVRGSGPLLLLAGKAYAYAEIQIGGYPAMRVGKAGNATLMSLEPRASARYSGYRDLPSTLPPPSDSNISALQLYARLSPGADRGKDEGED
jgi:Pectate lyase superfamily protein